MGKIVDFIWDDAKALANFEKHRVTFEEAATVFADPLGYDFPDPDHSEDEDRFIMIGLSMQWRLLVVIFTERGDTIRLISARPATSPERKFYEQ